MDEILAAWQSEKRIPADKIIDRYFKNRRFIGSKDRAYVGEMVYWILRNLALLQHFSKPDAHADQGIVLVATALLIRGEYTLSEIRVLCNGQQYSPRSLTQSEIKTLREIPNYPVATADLPEHVRLNYPEWMGDILTEAFGAEKEKALLALNDQATTDLRVNTLKTTRDELLAGLIAEGFECIPTPTSPIGIRLKKRAPIFTSKYFKMGHFEVQDEGSQMVAELVRAAAGMKVIDFCAGAGGKTLAIAAQMNNKGRVMAWDTSEKRLTQIKDRLKRAGVDNVQIHVLDSENDAFVKRHKSTADRVLVDAPCSGTGTWRRNPDLKWRFNPTDLASVTAVQATILQSASRLVKPGGWLIYATCSVLKNENDAQAENFLKSNPNFRVVCAEKIWNKTSSIENKNEHRDKNVSYLSITPHQDGVDGFFAAVFERLA
jgi:16S rRNA (cytosine967-C5)-methyltransferase